MRPALRLMIGIAGTLAMLATSTMAAAANPGAYTPVGAQAQAPSPWMVLSVLGPSRAIALGGASAAAQPVDVPPPPAPPPGYAAAPALSGEVLPIFLWWGLIALALASSDHGPTAPITTPNSPG